MPHCPARPGPAGSTVTHQMRTILKKQLQDPAEAGGGNRSSKYCMPNCTIISQQGFKLLFLGWSVLAQVAAFPSPFSSEQARVFISCRLLIHTYVLSPATSKLLCFSSDPCVSSFLLLPHWRITALQLVLLPCHPPNSCTCNPVNSARSLS